jgi:hypothetical protein
LSNQSPSEASKSGLPVAGYAEGRLLIAEKGCGLGFIGVLIGKE